MYIQAPQFGFPSASGNSQTVGAPADKWGFLGVSEIVGRYSNLVKSGRVFSAYATLTAPVIYTTAAGTGGPLLHNPANNTNDAHLLAIGFSTSVVTTVAGGMGITGNSGQTANPTATTAIDAKFNHLIGGANPTCNVYRVGTPTNAGASLVPFAQFHTGALTVDNTGLLWVDLGGLYVVPPGSWASPAATATLTTLQTQVALVWAEIPA
jgi:hypothetical protein